MFLTEGEFVVPVVVGGGTTAPIQVVSGVHLIGTGQVNPSAFGTRIVSTDGGAGLGSLIHVSDGSVEDLSAAAESGDATIIFIDGAETLIRGVEVKAGTGNGINVDASKVTVEGCTFNMGTPGDGVHASDTGETLFGFRIINNHFRFGGGNAIYLGGSTSAVITGNTIEDSDLVGIFLEEATNAIVADNVVILPGQHGIQLDDCNNCDIHDNTITLTGWQADNTWDSIHLSGNSDSNMIQGNVCVPKTIANQPRYGINISAATCDDNVIVGNYLGITADYATLPLNDAGTNTVLQYPHDPVLGSNITDTAAFGGGLGDRTITRFSQDGTATYDGSGEYRAYFETAQTIISVTAALGTAPTGSSYIVDIHKNGTTIFTTQSNRPQIAAGTNHDAATLEVTAIAAGEFLTMDIDQVGASVTGQFLTVTVVTENA